MTDWAGMVRNIQTGTELGLLDRQLRQNSADLASWKRHCEKIQSLVDKNYDAALDATAQRNAWRSLAMKLIDKAGFTPEQRKQFDAYLEAEYQKELKNEHEQRGTSPR